MAAPFPVLPSLSLAPLPSFGPVVERPVERSVVGPQQAPADVAPRPVPGRHTRGVSGTLHAWQRDALALWRTANHRGIVDALGGAGRTRLGLEAVARAHADGLDSLVVVPDTATQQHWLAELAAHLPHVRAGALGGGATATFGEHDVIVALARTAARRRLLPTLRRGLLVADECHRLATTTLSAALDPAFERRLGLSADYEREDGAHAVYLQPYFGARVFHLGYDRAVRDGAAAPVAVALVGVELTRGERAGYERSHRAITESLAELRELGVEVADPGVGPLPAVIRELTVWNDGTRTHVAARRVQIHHARRRALLAEAAAKFRVLADLAPAVREAHAGVVYTQNANASATAAAVCSEHGVSLSAVHSGREREQRRTLADGTAAHLELVTEDAPAPATGCDLAIMLCANRGRRQLLQRLDRLVGHQLGVPPRMVVVYARDTVDDPSIAGDEHLRAIVPFAAPFGVFTDADPRAVVDFLRAAATPGPAYRGRHAVADELFPATPAAVVPLRAALTNVLAG